MVEMYPGTRDELSSPRAVPDQPLRDGRNGADDEFGGDPVAPGAVYLVRLAVLTGYVKMATSLGLDTRVMLKAAGLSPALLTHIEQLIPASVAIRLLEESARMSGCMTFGLRMGMARKLSDMGMIAILLSLQPTLADCLRAVDQHRDRIVPILALNLERHDDIAIIGLDLALPDAEPHRQANDLVLAASMLIIRDILGDDWRPECTRFSYPEPAPSDRLLYQQAFGDDVEFNAELNGFVIRAADLDAPREGADPAMQRYAETLIELALGPAQPSFARTVQQALMYLLGSSQPALPTTAAALGLNPRTLQRHLRDEGVSFRDLVDQTRMQLAARLLANPATRIAEVADALGYSSTGAFSRWYRQAFGRAPTEGR